MLKSSAINHYKTARAVAQALRIGESAVSQWGDVIPVLRAYQLQQLTKGALTVDEAFYPELSQATDDQAA